MMRMQSCTGNTPRAENIIGRTGSYQVQVAPSWVSEWQIRHSTDRILEPVFPAVVTPALEHDEPFMHELDEVLASQWELC